MVKEMSESKWQHHKTALPNLLRIKETGVDIWLYEQKKNISLVNCGAKIFWYRKCCNNQKGK